MDIISFFRNIDGTLYYVILVVNTILIFAILGYLGEKNNQKFIKMGLDVPSPNNSKSFDFSSVTTEKHNSTNIPTVMATAVSNNKFIEEIPNNTGSALPVDLNNQNASSGIQNNPPVTNNQSAINTSNGVNQPMINNEPDPNEKAPAILVINSDNTNMPK